MWTRRNYFIWFEFHSKNGKHISLPISLVAIRALIDSVLELVNVISYIVPISIQARKGKDKLTSMHLRQLLDTVNRMMVILSYEHRLELVEVESKDVNVKIVLR